jgi:hypothetical protein
MSEFGAIFDYDLSTAVYCWMGLGFIAAYGLFAMWGAQSDTALAAQPA